MDNEDITCACCREKLPHDSFSKTQRTKAQSGEIKRIRCNVCTKHKWISCPISKKKDKKLEYQEEKRNRELKRKEHKRKEEIEHARLCILYNTNPIEGFQFLVNCKRQLNNSYITKEYAVRKIQRLFPQVYDGRSDELQECIDKIYINSEVKYGWLFCNVEIPIYEPPTEYIFCRIWDFPPGTKYMDRHKLINHNCTRCEKALRGHIRALKIDGKFYCIRCYCSKCKRLYPPSEEIYNFTCPREDCK